MPDWMEMDTDPAGRVFDAIAAVGEDLAAGWRAALTMVEAGEAGIGDDRLAAAFRSGYVDSRDQTRATGAALPGRMADDAGVGHGSAADYLSGDQRAAAVLGNIGY